VPPISILRCGHRTTRDRSRPSLRHHKTPKTLGIAVAERLNAEGIDAIAEKHLRANVSVKQAM